MITLGGSTFDGIEIGHTVVPQISLYWATKSDGNMSAFDFGILKDRYFSKIKIFANSTQATNLRNIIDSSPNRANPITLISARGMFPFGPHLGDGTFTVFITDWRDMGDNMFKMFEFDLTLFLETAPAYTLPAQVGSGPISIGSITGIYSPETRFRPTTQSDFQVTLKGDNTGFGVDASSGGDLRFTRAIFRLRQSKAAALINHLVTTVRGNDMTLTVPANTFPFGTDFGSGPFQVKVLNMQNMNSLKGPFWQIGLTMFHVSGGGP